MKKAIFNFGKEDYKAFEEFIYDYMPHDKCKDIYEIIECLTDLRDYIQINGIVQKTCSPETPAYTIVRNIMYWYPDKIYEIHTFLFNYCDTAMELAEEEVRYEAILKKLKKYTRRKNAELDKFFGGNTMKKHIFESDQESFINELNDIANEKDVTRESLLDGAYKCICCDRNKQYGSPEDNFGIIARYWKEYLGVDITAMDVGIMMTLFKIGRMQSGGYKPDNFVDAIGYLACAGECGAKFNIDDGNKCGYGKCTDCWMKEEES